MSFNYSKLRGRIVEKFGTQIEFAKAIKISERTLSLKLNGKRYFTQNEIAIVTDILNIPENEIPLYFFTPKVQ